MRYVTAAGREVTSPEPRIPKCCGTELRLIIEGYVRPPDNKDCMRCWEENEDKKWQEELDNLSSSSDNGFVSEKESH